MNYFDWVIKFALLPLSLRCNQCRNNWTLIIAYSCQTVVKILNSSTGIKKSEIEWIFMECNAADHFHLKKSEAACKFTHFPLVFVCKWNKLFRWIPDRQFSWSDAKFLTNSFWCSPGWCQPKNSTQRWTLFRRIKIWTELNK